MCTWVYYKENQKYLLAIQDKAQVVYHRNFKMWRLVKPNSMVNVFGLTFTVNINKEKWQKLIQNGNIVSITV